LVLYLLDTQSDDRIRFHDRPLSSKTARQFAQDSNEI
jgi:hypothetical protein